MSYRKFFLYFLGVILIPALVGVGLSLYSLGTVPFSDSSSDRPRQNSKSDQRKRSPSKNQQSLRGLGYTGSAPMPEETGVTTHDSERAYGSLNYYCGGQGFQAYLIDMKGNVLHRWQYPFERAFGYELTRNPEGLRELGKEIPSPYWSRCHVFRDGSFLGLINDHGLVKLDRNSNLLWSHAGQFHHDIWVTEDRIYVLERQVSSVRNDQGQGDKILEESIVALNHQGEIVNRVSLIDALVHSDYSTLIFRTYGGIDRQTHSQIRTRDALHPNSLQVLGKDSAFVRELPQVDGPAALVSLRLTNTMFLVSLEKEKVVWALSDLGQGQHSARILPGGSLLYFDNWGNHDFDRAEEGALVFRGVNSRIMEVDPLTQNVLWRYGEKPSEQFYSKCCGRVQRLPNGNTLISQNKKGKTFEVTPEGEKVWEFRNPHPSVEESASIARISLKRLKKDFPRDWLAKE